MDLEMLFQVINRVSALAEQYDLMDQAYAQAEIQKEILLRVPESKQQTGYMKQANDQVNVTQSHRDAILRTTKDITGKSIGELRQTISELRLALTRYSEVELEYIKTNQAFELLVEANGFDEDEGSGGSRREYEAELSGLRQNKEQVVAYIRKLVSNCLNKQALVLPTDSVLGPLMRGQLEPTVAHHPV